MTTTGEFVGRHQDHVFARMAGLSLLPPLILYSSQHCKYYYAESQLYERRLRSIAFRDQLQR